MMEPFQEQDQSILRIGKWEQQHPRLSAGFTTRIGGVSQVPFNSFNLGLHVPDDPRAVIANRHLLAEKLDFPLRHWVFGEQIHETTIKVLTRHDRGKGSVSHEDSVKAVDGLISNDGGLLCTAFFADCVPLYFFDPGTGYIGIAHAGWKGTIAGIAGEMVGTFRSAGVDVRNLLAVIGPCISRENYEVDEHVAGQIPEPLREMTVTPKKDGRYLLDLKQLNSEILLQHGVLRNNIETTNFCTFRDKDLFFSHRRDKGKTGRMLGFIGYSTEDEEEAGWQQ